MNTTLTKKINAQIWLNMLLYLSCLPVFHSNIIQAMEEKNLHCLHSSPAASQVPFIPQEFLTPKTEPLWYRPPTPPLCTPQETEDNVLDRYNLEIEGVQYTAREAAHIIIQKIDFGLAYYDRLVIPKGLLDHTRSEYTIDDLITFKNKDPEELLGKELNNPGAEKNDRFLHHPLHIIAANGADPKLFEYYLDRGANPCALNHLKVEPIHILARTSNQENAVECVKHLAAAYPIRQILIMSGVLSHPKPVRMPADPFNDQALIEGIYNKATLSGQTPLINAVEAGNYEFGLYLLSQGADPNLCAPKEYLTTTLNLKSKSSKHFQDCPGLTYRNNPLYHSLIQGNVAFLKLLAGYKATINKELYAYACYLYKEYQKRNPKSAMRYAECVTFIEEWLGKRIKKNAQGDNSLLPAPN